MTEASNSQAPADPEFYRSLPKAELHLHIEGSLTAERMLALAERNGVTLPYAAVEDVEAAYQFDDLQSFLDLYYQGMSVLQTESDFYCLTMDYLEVCRREGIVHCEIGFDPQGHTERGIPFATVVSGITRAQDDAHAQWGQSSALIMNILRHLPVTDAFDAVEQARPYAARISAIGLDSSEVGFPPEPFAPVFSAARELGWHCVAHAGEEGPPAYVWGAIVDLAVDRIDHGIRSDEDDALMDLLIKRQMPLTVCPLSNVRLRAVPTMAKHNLMKMLQAGANVCVNSDDPTYFGGFLCDNFAAVARDLPMTINDAAQLARNSIRSSFLTDSQQQPILSNIDRWLEAQR
ncbi:MAG: adenosine deaminase [Pseudomonadaceae bacterium]|nr:adenosine deaminase [Pseudomonadaceae bacterium]